MMHIKTSRQFTELVSSHFFPYINLLKNSQVKNVEGFSKVSGEYLTVKLINSLLSDIEKMLQKKLINSEAKNFTLKFSDAQAIALYKVLLNLPVPADNYYFNLVRSNWIEMLDQQIFK